MISRNKILVKLENNSKKLHNLGVKRIGLFGSFARNVQTPSSDIDILVEFNIGQKNFDNYMHLKNTLEKIFKRKIDLVTKTALKPRIKNSVIKKTHFAQL